MSQTHQRLLIVDDNAGICRLLFEMFSDEGYTAEVAQSGEEAIRKACANNPSLILLDVKMPGMSGLETLGKLKKLVPGVPVVLMTAYTESDVVRKAKEDGLIHNYLSKPFDMDEIRCLVRDILAEKKSGERVCV